MADLLSCDQGANKFYRHSGFSADVKESFAGPGSNLICVAWDGDNLLSADLGTNRVYKHDGFSATIDTFLSLTRQGIGWDGTNLLSATPSTIYRHVGFSTTIDTSINSPHIQAVDLAWTGTDLISMDQNNETVYLHDGFSETIQQSFQVTGNGFGVDWHDGNLYTADPNSKIIYKRSGFSATILGQFTFSAATTPTALAFMSVELFTVTLQYKQAGGAFVDVTSELGDTGASIGLGSKTCYWDDPGQDRANVEISDAQVQLTLVPDANNEGTHSVNVTSATQLSAGDGTGTQGDVKVEYEIA